MNKLTALLEWYADQAGMRFLELCANPQEGYEDVRVTANAPFYGVRSTLAPAGLERFGMVDIENLDTVESHFTPDFPREFIPRFFRIATDMLRRSRIEGFEFYNGRLARLHNAYAEFGRSAHQPRLHLHVGGTSYFTAVATNIHMRGYRFRHLQRPHEPPLTEGADWVSQPDWREALQKSLLANALAMHLFVYNDQEVIYLRRGKVGQAAGLWSSTVNGVMEFANDSPDLVNRRPDVGATAARETLYELNIEISPEKIKWIGLIASKARYEPAIVGVYRTDLSMSQIAGASLEGKEQREIREKSKTTFRQKEFRSISRKWEVKTKDISFGFGTLTVPYQVSSPANLRKVIEEKILQRKEQVRFQRESYWTDYGSVALLCCLAHLINRNELTMLLASIKEKYIRLNGRS